MWALFWFVFRLGISAKQPTEVYFQKSCFKKIHKHLCQSLFFNKVAELTLFCKTPPDDCFGFLKMDPDFDFPVVNWQTYDVIHPVKEIRATSYLGSQRVRRTRRLRTIQSYKVWSKSFERVLIYRNPILTFLFRADAAFSKICCVMLLITPPQKGEIRWADMPQYTVPR